MITECRGESIGLDRRDVISLDLPNETGRGSVARSSDSYPQSSGTCRVSMATILQRIGSE